ncbi:MAG: undecaprenyl diphosphate synthase family protein, partial [Phycisphaerales bacterium]|nr:undecaprenyl diphosphate synthase family protein [Phycisphaerales bacterium]
WKRPPAEVDDLMGLLRLYLRREISDLNGNNVRVRFIGMRHDLAKDIRALIDEAEGVTAGNDGMTLVIALNYGSHNEILAACRRLAEQAAAGTLV